MHHLVVGLVDGRALLFGVIYFIFWLWMLIDAITSSRLDKTAKVVWVLVIFFIPCLGLLLYMLVGRRRGLV